jgi:hypothetical protein
MAFMSIFCDQNIGNITAISTGEKARAAQTSARETRSYSAATDGKLEPRAVKHQEAMLKR